MRKVAITFFVILLIVNFLYVLSGALNFSLRSIDVYSIWLYKAKAFFLLGVSMDSISNWEFGHPQYPILLPLLFSGIYKLVNGVNEMLIFVIYPVIYSLILFIVYRLFRTLGLNVLLSLIAVYIYSMFGPLLAQGGRHHAGTADIWLVLFNWSIVYLALIFFRNKEKIYQPILITVLIAISSQIKAEGPE